MDDSIMTSNRESKFEPMDGSFAAQCDRINRLVDGGCVTAELGSLILHYYALGREEASEDRCDAASYARDNFNKAHEETIAKYRAARPADLVINS